MSKEGIIEKGEEELARGKWCEPCQDFVRSSLHVHCPKCGSHPREHEVRNFDRMWGDGDVFCKRCETRVRDFDSG